jgi:hypothetical protein
LITQLVLSDLKIGVLRPHTYVIPRIVDKMDALSKHYVDINTADKVCTCMVYTG